MAGEPIIAQHGGKVQEILDKAAEERSERKKATTPEAQRTAAQNFLLRSLEFYAAINKKTKYDRIRRVKTSEPATLISRLTRTASSDAVYKFLQIKPHEIAALVPTIRLFLVYSGDDEAKRHKSIELKFEDKTSADIASITSDSRGRGQGIGVRSFRVETQGRNPAEGALVKCDLEVFFQNIEMLATQSEQENPSSSDYIELILRRTKNPAKTHDSRGDEIPYSRITNRFGFRLMAVVGWAVPEGRFVEQKLKDFLRETQQVIYLHLTDHTIDFKQDGTGLLTCNYQGAIERAFSSDTVYDVLAVSEENKLQADIKSLEKDIERKQKDGEKIDRDDKEQLENTQDQITKLKEQLQKSKKDLRAKRYSQLIGMLFNPRTGSNKLYSVDLTPSDKERFRKGEAFGPSSGPPPKEEAEAINQLDHATALKYTKDLGLLGTEKFNFKPDKIKKPTDSRISFIFFGDIIEAAKQVVEKNFKDSKTARAAGLDDFEILLGPMTFKKKVDGKYMSGIVNLADVPISLKSYEAWFNKNIKKQNLDSLSLRAFLRSATTELVLVALGQFMGLDKKTKIKNQVGIHTFMGKPLSDSVSTIDLDEGTRMELIKPKDLEGGGENGKELKNIKPYIVLYASLEVPDTRDPKNIMQDMEDGIYHLHLGSDRGIVKSINFSKTDIPYNKESRLTSQDAEEGQLRDKYDATIELIGSSFLFRPGQKLYINPTLSGFGNINSEKSVARLLGLGGYYDIITVSSEFSRDSGYTTSLKCAWTSFGGLTKVNQQTETIEEKTTRAPSGETPGLTEPSDTPQETASAAQPGIIVMETIEIDVGPAERGLGDRVEEEVDKDPVLQAEKKLEQAQTELRNIRASAQKRGPDVHKAVLPEIRELQERAARADEAYTRALAAEALRKKEQEGK